MLLRGNGAQADRYMSRLSCHGSLLTPGHRVFHGAREANFLSGAILGGIVVVIIIAILVFVSNSGIAVVGGIVLGVVNAGMRGTGATSSSASHGLRGATGTRGSGALFAVITYRGCRLVDRVSWSGGCSSVVAARLWITQLIGN
jgi:hypothetical protein